MIFLIFFLIILSFLASISILKKYFHFYKLARKIPIPKNWSFYPIIGHAHHVIGKLDELIKCCEIYRYLEKPHAMWMGPSLFVVISSAEQIEVVLNSSKCINKSKFFRHFKAAGGDGLILSDVPKWRKHRKMLNPMFNQRILDTFVEIFAKHHSKMCANLGKRISAEFFDILQDTKECNFDIFLETSLGIVQENDQYIRNTYLKSLERALRIISLKIVNPLYHLDFLFNLTPSGRELKIVSGKIFQICNNIFASNLESKRRSISQDDGLEKKKPILLNYLMEHYQNGTFSQQEVVDELAVFIAAVIMGVETCAAEFSFVCLMLAIHPDVQEKVYSEVIEILGCEEGLNYKDLPLLNYTEKTIKETMRLFPVGPFMIRRLNDDILIDDVWLPQGSEIAINVFGVQRSAKHYKDPEKFIPDRFDDANFEKLHRYSYIPFSAGPRNCIGWKFAMMSLKTSIALFVRSFHLETTYKSVEEIRVEQPLTINAIDGYPIKLSLRN